MSTIDALKELFGIGEYSTDRTLGAMRSSMWSSVRKAYITKNPLCAVCEKKGTILSPNQVHHKAPFSRSPELELKESNLITLCQRCHLLIGHLGSFKSYNATVEKDAEYLRAKINSRP